MPNYPKGNIAIAIRQHQVIAGYGENVFCPNCMSKNRERLVVAFLKEMADLKGLWKHHLILMMGEVKINVDYVIM